MNREANISEVSQKYLVDPRTCSAPGRAFFVLLILFCAITSSSLQAAGQPFEKKLDDAVVEFKSKKLAADRYVVKQLGKYRTGIKRDKTLSEASRADLLSRMDRYIRNFKSNGTFPNIVESVELEIKYQERLNRAFSPISRMLESELKIANRKEDVNYSQELLKTKRRLESKLLSSQPVTNGMVFHGTLTRPSGDTIPYKLKIDYIGDSGDFEGTVEDNPGVAGHWRYKVTGNRVGSMIRFQMSENLRGRLTVVQAQGFVAGNRLIAQLNQKTAKSKGSQNMLMLRR